MFSKFYFYLRERIQELELELSGFIQKRLAESCNSRLFYFSAVYLNLKLVALEIFSDLVKFLVIVFADPSQGFRLFYNQRDLQACPYSYSGFRETQKKIRTFSGVGLVSMVAVAVVSSLITNLIFGGKLSGQAAVFGWSQNTWSGGATTTHAKHLNLNDRTDWSYYAAKDAAVDAADSIQLLPQAFSVIQRSSDGSLDTINAGGYSAGLVKNQVVVTNNKIMLAARSSTTYPTGASLTNNASGIAFDPVTNSVWVSRSYNTTRIDINTGNRLDVAVGGDGWAVAFDSYTNSIWRSNFNGTMVHKINVSTGVSTNFTLGGDYRRALAYDAATHSIWTTGWSTVVSKVNVVDGTYVNYGMGGSASSMAFDALNNLVWVNTGNGVQKIDVNTGAATYCGASTNANSGIAFDPVTNSAWVTFALNNNISRINAVSCAAVTYPTGQTPYGVTFDPVTNSIWVANSGSNSISKINIFTGTKTDYGVGTNPRSIVFEPVTNSVWVTNVGNSTVSKMPNAIYYSTGTFESAIINLPKYLELSTLSYDATVPASTSISINVRAGTSSVPDSGWSAWSANLTSGADISGLGLGNRRYFQYRVNLSAANADLTPSLNSLTIGYNSYPASSTLTSSWYDTSDPANTLSRISWNEDVLASTSVKFQIRTAGASSTNPGQPDTPGSWVGPDGTTGTYFSSATTSCPKTATTVNCQIFSSSLIGDHSDDRWMQYRVTLESAGDDTPVADNANIQYVVNNPPEIQTGSFIVSQSTSTGQVEVGYAVYDSDTDSGSGHPGFVVSTLQYWDGADWVDASTTLVAHNTGSSTVAVSTSTYNAYSLTWNIAQEPALAALLVADFVVRLAIDDGEPANNLAYATTSIRLDTKDPAIGPSAQPLTLDSRPAASQPVIAYFDMTDDSPLYFKLGGDAALSGVADWTPYVSTTSLDMAGLGTTSAYVQFKDEYNNYSDVFRVFQNETPGNIVIRDLTNADVNKYMEFIAWKAITTYNGTFKTYQVWRATSTLTEGPGEYQLVGTTTQNQLSKNYYLDESVSPDTVYYYKVAAEDHSGNVSMFSETVKDNPDGQGGTDNTPPTISNIEIIASSTQSVTIAWDTDELASSYVGYSQTPGDFTTVVGYDTMVDKATSTGGTMGRHQVTIGGLSASTTYYYQIKSVDPGSNTGLESLDRANGDIELRFTTKPGPQISEVKVDYTQLTNTSVAVKWLTDLESDSVVVYSVNPDLTSPAEIQGLTGTTTEHEVKLENLLPRTKYYFYVKSARTIDGQVEEAYDKNIDANGIIQYYQFETTYDQTPPTISAPSCQLTVTNGTTTPALIITATTSEPALIHFAYGLATSTYDQEQATTTNFNIDQIVLIENLEASTTYHFQFIAIDKSGNPQTSDDFFCSTGEKLATQEEVGNAYKAGQSKGTEEGVAQGRNSVQSSGGTIIIDKTDKIPPIISNIRIDSLTATSAIVSWMTSEAADGLVKYFSANHKYSTGDDALILNHEAGITNLEPKTNYSYVISSADSSGNLAKSEQLSFATPDLTQAEAELIASTTKAETQAQKEDLVKTVIEKAMDIFQNMAGQISLGSLESSVIANYNTLDKLAQLIPAPVLGGEPAVDITPTTATIRWKTDKQANSMVAYAPEGLYAPGKGSRGYLQLVGEPNQSATDHTVKIVGLKPDSVYHYQLRSKAKVGVEATSRDFVFRTKPEALEIISVNTETLSNTRAKFTWLTSQETDTELAYTPYRNGKLSPDETKTIYDKTVTTNHELEAKDLEAGVVYQFEIRARDKKGIRISKTISFFSTTKDDLPPEITDIQTESALSQSKDAKVQTIMTWTTSEPTVSQIRYAKGVFENEQDLTEETPLETVYSRKHTIVVTKFEIGEVYSFRVVATDSGGNQTVSSPHIVLTPKQKEGVFELIINTFESTFGWLGKMK